MAFGNNYYGNNQGVMPDPNDRQYAIDWEAKSIPLVAYRNCLIAKEDYLLALKGTPNHVPLIAKNKFMSAISIFYDTVETGFAKHLSSEEYKKAPFRIGQDIIGVDDYEMLMTVLTVNMLDVKLFLLFKILKNWCFEKGPFQTFTEQEDEDVFERIDNEE